MSAQPVRASGQAIDFVLAPLRLLRECPNHCQAQEWRQELERVRTAAPDVYAAAEKLVNSESA